MNRDSGLTGYLVQLAEFRDFGMDKSLCSVIVTLLNEWFNAERVYIYLRTPYRYQETLIDMNELL